MDNHNHNHHFMLKVSRFLPSSCQFRTLPDVAEESITCKIPHENDPSNPIIPSSLPKRNLISQPPKCPPKLKQHNPLVSSSSNSAWFTSADDFETDTFFSISSNSGDSFRLKSGRIFRKCEEMKSIDETGNRSDKCSRRAAKKGTPEFALGSDHISTQIYYGGSEASLRRRKNRRKTKKREPRRSLDYKSMIGESYAVEKRSSDPGGDFRASMVEMIVEKQIFAAEDLERLLLCFLSLNAVSYHGIIFHVFTEICQTLFSN